MNGPVIWGSGDALPGLGNDIANLELEGRSLDGS
jgi:hypothetical protein